MIIRKIAQKTGKYTLFLICLLISLILFPVVEDYSIGNICLNAWCLITMAALAISLQDDKRHFKRTLYIGGFVFGLIFISLIGQILAWDSNLIYHLLLPACILFITYIIWVILASIFRTSRIGADQLSGAIVAYSLIGISWALLYSFIELLYPNSFSLTAEVDMHAKGSALFYYSFVTLTTLGYGDILPVSKFARMSAYLEAVTGVMYTAILVAGLVGHIGNHKNEGN